MIFIWKLFWLRTLSSSCERERPKATDSYVEGAGVCVCVIHFSYRQKNIPHHQLPKKIFFFFFLGACWVHPKMPSCDYTVWIVGIFPKWRRQDFSLSLSLSGNQHTHTKKWLTLPNRRRRAHTHTHEANRWRKMMAAAVGVRCRATYGRQTRQDYWDDASEIDLFPLTSSLSLSLFF
jgi:hypothetical protein